MNFRALLKLLGALLSGAVTYSLLRELLGKHILSGVYIPIPVTPLPSTTLAPNEAPTALAAGPSTVNVAMPATSAAGPVKPDHGKTTVAFSVAFYQLEVGGSGRDLKIKKELKSSDFDNPPPTSLNIAPGATVPITFQVKSSAKVDHVAVIVASTVQKKDGDSLYRGVGIVAIP